MKTERKSVFIFENFLRAASNIIIWKEYESHVKKVIKKVKKKSHRLIVGE
jgi:hypothetical protein